MALRLRTWLFWRLVSPDIHWALPLINSREKPDHTEALPARIGASPSSTLTQDSCMELALRLTGPA